MVKKLIRPAFLILMLATIFSFIILKPLPISTSKKILLSVVPDSANTLHVNILNDSDTTVSFSNEYFIEAKSLIGWRKAGLGMGAFTSLGHTLESGETYSFSVNYDNIYGSLVAGDYRFIKEFAYDDDTIYVCGYFTIE